MQTHINKFTFSTLLAGYCGAILCFHIEYANILLEKKIGTPQPIAYFENITIKKQRSLLKRIHLNASY